MSKIIAVNGPPGSGKTTLALNLAKEIHEKTRKKVLYISPDTMIPAMGLIFARREKDSLYSLGKALENVNLAYTDFLGVTHTTKAMPNLGFVGYAPRENSHSYAEVKENKVVQMYQILRDNFDFVVLDCDRNREDLISAIGCGLSDHVVQIINPDIKSIAYYGGEPMSDRAVLVLNMLDNDIYLPIQDMKSKFPDIQFMIPYNRAAKLQMCEGTLMDLLKDPVYRKSIKPLVELLVKEPEPEEEQPKEEEPLLDEKSEDFWR